MPDSNSSKYPAKFGLGIICLLMSASPLSPQAKCNQKTSKEYTHVKVFFRR
jgi:hypothetical protein